MARGGDAAGGGPWRGRSGAREPSSQATAVAPGTPGGFALAAGLASSRALRGPVVGGWEEEIGNSPGQRVRGASQHPRGWGVGIRPSAWLSPPARVEAGEQKAGASCFFPLFSPPYVPGRRAKVGTESGPAGRGWGRLGRCPDFAFPSRGGERAGRRSCLPGDAPRLILALALRAGWVPAASRVGPAERLQPGTS